VRSAKTHSFRGVDLDLYRRQAVTLLQGLGFDIDQTQVKKDPLQFLHVAQLRQQERRDQLNNLKPDEKRYAESMIPYLRENSSKRSRTPESLAGEVVKELKKPQSNRCSYLIFGSAGTGKSVYLATLFSFIKQDLVRTQQGEPQLHIPVLHSNLKESKSLSSTTFTQRVILDGIRLNECFPAHDVQNLEQLSSLLKLGQGKFKKGILLIDALDEYLSTNDKTKIEAVREQLTQVNQELQVAGFIPIWSCRTREYKRLKLDELFHEGEQSGLGRVRRYNIPYLDTQNLADVCMLDEVVNPPSKILRLLKKFGDKDGPPKRVSKADRDFIGWLGRATMMNPLFFYFRIFSPPQVSRQLTHQLIENMYATFRNEIDGELIEPDNFVEKQNLFVLSDLLITTLVKYLKSTYEKDYKIGKALAHLVEGYQSNIPVNPEDVTKILPKIFDDKIPLEENTVFVILKIFGIFHTVGKENERLKFRHRSFAEFFGICHTSGVSVDPRKCKEMAANNKSIWGWRRYDEASIEELKDPMFQRTGGFALSIGRFTGLGTYQDKMKEIHQGIIDKSFNSSDTRSIRSNKRRKNNRFSTEQQDTLKRGLNTKHPIILKGWPGTGKTFTGTHFLISRLVNRFIKSGRTLYLPETEPKGLIVTLNPELSRFLKSPQELDVYKKGPWTNLLHDNPDLTVRWEHLRQSIDVYSMVEIIRKLDAGDGNSRLNIVDLKDVYEKYWQGIYLTKKKFLEQKNHRSYSWKEAASDLQNRFYDEFGFFSEECPEVNDEFASARDMWHSVVKTHLGDESNTHTIQSACIKLIHRFIQSFDLYGTPEVEVTTRLSEHDTRTEIERQEAFRNNEYLERFSVALVDEVQDLPVAACVLIAMIVTRDENVSADHVMFAGDENQVINQSDFSWSSFYNGHKRLTNNLAKFYKKSLNYNSYLVSSAAKTLGDEPVENFVDNYRNLPSIVDTWKRAGSWNIDKQSPVPDLEGIEDCESVLSVDDPNAVKFVYINDPKNTSSKASTSLQITAVKELVEFVSKRSGISLISMSDIVDKFKEKEDNNKTSLFAQTELFTPNTIKGLERDTVILLGTLAYNRSLSPQELESERMKLIVGMSRGKKKLIVFTPFSRKGSTLNFAQTKELTGHQYHLDHFVTDHNQILEISSNQNIKDELELLLPRDDRLASFVALEELMQANAYRSDQIAATRKRVVAILEQDLRPKNVTSFENESLFTHYAEHELKFNYRKNHEIPVEVKIFFLDIDIPLIERIHKSNFKSTDSTISGLLLKYKTDHLLPSESKNHLQMIQSRHQLYTDFDQFISRLENNSKRPRPIYDEGEVKRTISRFEQNLVDGLNETRELMDFYEYPWNEDIKNDPKLALLTYLSRDHEDISRQLEGMSGPLNDVQFETLESLSFEISSTPFRTFQTFKQLCDDLEVETSSSVTLESFTGCIETLLVWLHNTYKNVTKQLEEEILRAKSEVEEAEENARMAKALEEEAAQEAANAREEADKLSKEATNARGEAEKQSKEAIAAVAEEKAPKQAEAKKSAKSMADKTARVADKAREKVGEKQKLLARQHIGFLDAFDQFLHEFPVQHLDLLSQTSVLVLIRELMASTARQGVDLKEDRLLQTSLARLLNIYFSKHRWLKGKPHPDHRLKGGIVPMQLRTFQEIYKVLDSTTIANLNFDSLPFAFRQHDLRAKWEENQSDKLLVTYKNFFEDVTNGYLAMARIFNPRDWKWINQRLENDATGVLEDGVENFLLMLSSNMTKWQNPNHVREVATNIVRILLTYRAEHYILPKTQSTNAPIHQRFQGLLESLMTSNLVDAEKLVSSILQQIEDEVLRSETDRFGIISIQNKILYGWASLIYLRDHKLHTFNAGSLDRMRALNHRYPILNLPSDDVLDLHMKDLMSQHSSSLASIPTLSSEFWKIMSDNEYLNKNWFSRIRILDYTRPSDRPVYLLTDKDAAMVEKNSLPYVTWSMYHETLGTFEQTNQILLNSSKQCEVSDIKFILSVETYHASIVPLLKAIMKRVHQMTKEGPNRTVAMGVSTICNKVREYAAYKDWTDEQTGRKHRTVPWAFEAVFEIERAKQDPEMVKKFNEAYKRLEAENPVTTSKEITPEQKSQQAALKAQAYEVIHEDIVDHVVAKQWNKAVAKFLRHYFHFHLSEGDTTLSYSRNGDKIEGLRNWVS